MNAKTILTVSALLLSGCSDDDNSLRLPPMDNAPSISVIGDQSVTANMSSGQIDINVNDDVTSAGDLSVTASSDNPALVMDAGIVLEGSGQQRTLQLIPEAGQTGTAIISVTVTDALGQAALEAFTLTVTPEPAQFDIVLRSTFSAAPTDQPQSLNDKEFNNDEASTFDDLLAP